MDPQKLQHDVQTLQKSIVKVTKLQKDIDKLKLLQDIPGYARFSVPALSPHWLQPYVQEETNLTLTIPSGTSYVEAKKLMHFFHLTNLPRLELDFTEKRRDACKISTKKSTFVDNCVAEVSVYNSAISRLGIDLEGQDVTVTGTNEKNVAVHASKIWQTTIDRLAVELIKKDKKEAAELEKKKTVIDTLAKKKPADWLAEAIDARIRKGKNRGTLVMDGYAINPTEVASDTLAAGSAPNDEEIKSLIVEQPKNGKTPGGTRGSANNPKTPGPKAKAKPKAKPKKPESKPPNATEQKGKGKGQGQGGPSKGKGKGKGKNKGKSAK